MRHATRSHFRRSQSPGLELDGLNWENLKPSRLDFLINIEILLCQPSAPCGMRLDPIFADHRDPPCRSLRWSGLSWFTTSVTLSRRTTRRQKCRLKIHASTLFWKSRFMTASGG